MLDLILCLPIMFGCPTKIKPEGDLAPRVCPMCHNAAVQGAKSRMWFELCFIPLIPMKSKRVWICPICNWSMPIQPGWQPQVAGEQYYPNPQHGYMDPMGGPQGFSTGYQPGYMNPQQKPM